MAEVEVEPADDEDATEGFVYAERLVLPKKGDLSNPNNWRGIMLLDAVGKIYRELDHLGAAPDPAQAGAHRGAVRLHRGARLLRRLLRAADGASEAPGARARHVRALRGPWRDGGGT